MQLAINGNVVDIPTGGGGSGDSVPIGGIIMWSGSVDEVPSGYHLCDGTEGTPDLRDRFILGAGPTYEVGATGGEAEHTLTAREIPSHRHTYSQPMYNKYITKSSVGDTTGYAYSDTSMVVSTSAIGSNGSHNNMPPYYVLAFIMKISGSSGSGGSGGSSEENYSEDEVRIGTWVNGKPLYKRTITTSTKPEGTFGFQYADYDIDELCDISGFVRQTEPTSNTGTTQLFLNSYIPDSSAKYFICSVKGRDEISVSFNSHGIQGNSLNITCNWYITIKYTKTTDKATNS